MQQDLNDLVVFAAVVECGSLTAAAESLGIGKSQVSQRLARLERRLDMHLLHRTTRQQHVTDFGRQYYQHCREVVAAAERAQRSADRATESPAGTVRAACPPLFSELVLRDIVVDFMRAFPDVTLALEQRDRDVDVVAEGYELAFRVRATIDDSSLVARTVGDDSHLLLASPGLLEERPVQHPEDLESLPSLALAATIDHGRYLWRLTGRHGALRVVRHAPRLITNDMILLRTAAEAGHGVVALPAFLCARAIAEGRLAIVLPQWSLPAMNVHIVYPSRQGRPPAVRRFIEFVAPRIGQRMDQLHAMIAEPVIDADLAR